MTRAPTHSFWRCMKSGLGLVKRRNSFELQEKLNAYLSFVLDGELKDAYPDLTEKNVEIQLRTVHEPDEKAFDFIRRAREQLELQQIGFEVIRLPLTSDGAEHNRA